MTSTVAYPYTFDSMSRIGNDNPALDQRNIQNINVFFDCRKDCFMGVTLYAILFIIHFVGVLLKNV